MKVECCLWEVRAEGQQPTKEPGQRNGGFWGNEHNTCERACLFQWGGSVITWRGGNGQDVRRRFKREGTHVYPRFIPVDVRQKSHQYCKAIRNQWKINKLKKNQLRFGDRATYLGGWCELLRAAVWLLVGRWLTLALYFAGWCSAHRTERRLLCLSCQRTWQLRWRLSDACEGNCCFCFSPCGALSRVSRALKRTPMGVQPCDADHWPHFQR